VAIEIKARHLFPNEIFAAFAFSGISVVKLDI